MSSDSGKGDGKGDGKDAKYVAKVGLIGAVVAAVAGIAVAWISKPGPNPAPTPPGQTATLESTAAPTVPVNPSVECPRTIITVTAPAADAAPIEPGTNVTFRGTVACLPAGHDFWLVSRVSNSSKFYIATSDPLANGDNNGDWETTVYKIGDSSDRGGSRTFFGVDANDKCSAVFEKVKNDVPRTVDALPSGCVRLKPDIVVRFAK